MNPTLRLAFGVAIVGAGLALPAVGQAQFGLHANVDVDVDVDFSLHGGTHHPRRGRHHGHVVVEEEHHDTTGVVPGPTVVQPPTVVVPAPPAAPSHTVVVTPTPAPPQVVVVQQAPTRPSTPPVRATVQPGNYAPPVMPFRPHRDAPPARTPTIGLHGSLAGIGGGGAALAGGSVALRFRTNPRYALDIGLAGFDGVDWAGRSRTEGMVFVDGRLYLNPKDSAQLYGVGGLAVSVAETYEETGSGCDPIEDASCDPFLEVQTRQMTHLTGSLGAGLELRLSPFFSVDIEARALLRQKVSDSVEAPEYVETVTFPDGSEHSRGTNTSAGALVGVGATLYF